jgi:hypothetical protein
MGAPGLNYNEVKERVIPSTNHYGGTSAKAFYNEAKERVVPRRTQGPITNSYSGTPLRFTKYLHHQIA